MSATGNVAIVDEKKQAVFTFTPRGDLISTIDMVQRGAKCSNPQYLTISNQNDVIVSDSGKHAVFIFKSNGDLKMTLGTPGRAGNRDDQFYQPHDLTTDKYDNLIIADRENKRIQLFGSDGQFKATLLSEKDGLKYPTAVHLTQDNKLLVGEHTSKKVLVFDYKL